VIAPRRLTVRFPSAARIIVRAARRDLAWLWPIRETMRKSARTCATVLANMDRFPGYMFGMSQPQQLQWIKDQHPEIFKRIQQRVAEGRWECQGCMWVEPDTNVTGGESFVRQTMHGQRFWQQNFHKTVNHLWEPDVFGYTAALPQILRKSGISYVSATTQPLCRLPKMFLA
jgi:alpha-mannosidase